VRGLAGDAATTHVLFNNCYRKYVQVNARQLTELLRTYAGLRSARQRRCGGD